MRYLLVFHCACPSFLSFGPCSISDQKDPKERMVQVVKWYLSAFHAGRKGSVAKKPYNPILGEIFRCHWVLPGTEGEDDMVSFLWYVFWCLECMPVIPKASLIYCLKWPMLCLSHKLTNYSNFLTDSTPLFFFFGERFKISCIRAFELLVFLELFDIVQLFSFLLNCFIALSSKVLIFFAIISLNLCILTVKFLFLTYNLESSAVFPVYLFLLLNSYCRLLKF